MVGRRRRDSQETNPDLTRPKLEHHVAMWNTWGEKFSGYVIQHHGKNKAQFKIKEDETQAELWTDLRNLNFWEYVKPPEEEEVFWATGIPTPAAAIAWIELG